MGHQVQRAGLTLPASPSTHSLTTLSIHPLGTHPLTTLSIHSLRPHPLGSDCRCKRWPSSGSIRPSRNNEPSPSNNDRSPSNNDHSSSNNDPSFYHFSSRAHCFRNKSDLPKCRGSRSGCGKGSARNQWQKTKTSVHFVMERQVTVFDLG